MRLKNEKKMELPFWKDVNFEKASNKEINEIYSKEIERVMKNAEHSKELAYLTYDFVGSYDTVTKMAKDYVKHSKTLQKSNIRRLGKLMAVIGLIGIVTSLGMDYLTSQTMDLFIPDTSRIFESGELPKIVDSIVNYYSGKLETLPTFKVASALFGLGLVVNVLGYIRHRKQLKVEEKRVALELFATKAHDNKNNNNLKELIYNYEF